MEYRDGIKIEGDKIGMPCRHSTVILERCRSSWGEPERGRADIGMQAGMHNTWMCGQMRPLATCLALSRVAIVLYNIIGMACRYFPSHYGTWLQH